MALGSAGHFDHTLLTSLSSWAGTTPLGRLGHVLARALATQEDDPGLRAEFAPLAEELTAAEERIVSELNSVQGTAVDLGGYFQPDDTKADSAMRPSPTLNGILQR